MLPQDLKERAPGPQHVALVLVWATLRHLAAVAAPVLCQRAQALGLCRVGGQLREGVQLRARGRLLELEAVGQRIEGAQLPAQRHHRQRLALL